GASPRPAVPADELVGARRAPRARGIVRERWLVALPARHNRVDEEPLFLDLVGPRAQRLVAEHHLEDQALVRLRDPRPAVAAVELRGYERLGHRTRRGAFLLAIGDDLLALDKATSVLAAHHGPRPWSVQRSQHLDLLVVHRVGGEVDRRLHRRQREQLQEVVLEDVADRAGVLVVGGAGLDPDRLGVGGLDVVGARAAPYWLDDTRWQAGRRGVR